MYAALVPTLRRWNRPDDLQINAGLPPALSCRLRRLPVESITLVGLSYGGAVAVSTAARHELPIASLLLISPVADFQMIVGAVSREE